MLDHDPTVVGVASQPFWLFWATADGKSRSHAPDYFARRADGSAVVIDCRPAERIKPRDAAKFDATRDACELVGWDYRLVGVPTQSWCATCAGWPVTDTLATRSLTSLPRWQRRSTGRLR